MLVLLGIAPSGAGFFILAFWGMRYMSDIEIYENDLLFYLDEFCERNKIEDIKKESQSVWNSALYYIQKKLFDINYFKSKENYKLDNGMYKESNFNSYNFELVMYVLDIYIYDMCMKYDKEVSILGFSSLTGIPDSTIYDWGEEYAKPDSIGDFRKTEKISGGEFI